jgi:hypothetical protein
MNSKELQELVKVFAEATSLAELEALEPALLTAEKEAPRGLTEIARSFFIESKQKLEQKGIAEEQKGIAEEQKGIAEEQQGIAEERLALANGTYYEDANGLWSFTKQDLPTDRNDQQIKFNKIARWKRPKCYREHSIVYEPPRKVDKMLPRFENRTVGSNSQVRLTDYDMFGNYFNRMRAHLAPDSKTCAPSWGHAAEGALGKIEDEIEEEKKIELRRLLVMGPFGDGTMGFRYSPFNFIRFYTHKDYFDAAPHVMIVPILTIHQILKWNNTPYDVLVIASEYNGTPANLVYQAFCPRKKQECSSAEISTATKSLTAFMVGLAASLLMEVPIKLNPNKNKRAELIEVKDDIEVNGIALPHFDVGKHIRPVMKVRIGKIDDHDEVITDPWMLTAKAAVNLSWCQEQKLLPACKPKLDISEEYRAFLDKIAAQPIPTTISVPALPTTPGQVGRGGIPSVTPEKEEEDWVPTTPGQVGREGIPIITPDKDEEDYGEEEEEDWENLE